MAYSACSRRVIEGFSASSMQRQQRISGRSHAGILIHAQLTVCARDIRDIRGDVNTQVAASSWLSLRSAPGTLETSEAM
eukprot:1161622-Pelagomonas_calceolata.AAC.8